MAERRMFSKSIIDSDAFLDMPPSTQNLYFHLGMMADDDGFVNNPSKIMRMINAVKNDHDLLIVKGFIIPFQSGVCVIKHWRIHNYLRNDRYKPTTYQEEKAALYIKDNGSYSLGIPNGNQTETECLPAVDAGKVRLGEDSIEEESIGESNGGQAATHTSKRFQKPTLEQVTAYCQERRSNVDPQRFIDFYESKGWLVGKTPMKDWKACVRTWEKDKKPTPGSKGGGIDYEAEAAKWKK